ncbi:MAG: pyridoxamine 5'-phosphate oxidase family protein [Dehalococcoidales bacterium]|nr:pyridoxamine 5'-phosphate oxidase family protein [Dehalococcoidales bacterium]
MDKKEILEFIANNPIAYMGTVEDGKPRVRAMGTYRSDENGIIFSMQSPKDVYKQLVANPETECCYFANGVQVRVHGTMEESKDQALKEEIAAARTFYKPGIDEQGWDYVGVFILKNGKATVLDMSKQEPAGTPKTWVDL